MGHQCTAYLLTTLLALQVLSATEAMMAQTLLDVVTGAKCSNRKGKVLFCGRARRLTGQIILHGQLVVPGHHIVPGAAPIPNQHF